MSNIRAQINQPNSNAGSSSLGAAFSSTQQKWAAGTSIYNAIVQ
jgi:hypothetical protein